METTPLTPIEHVFTGTGSHPIEFVFSYEESIDPIRLQSSLEETLDHFPLLGSKLFEISDHTYGFRLDPRGRSFETTRSSESFDDSENVYEFLNPVETEKDEPLTRIKLTQTPGGSVLGVSISHALVDGFSYFHFLSSWSRIFNRNAIVAPVHNRELLTPALSNHRGPVTPDEVLARSGLFLGDERGELSRDQIHWETLLLSRSMLSDLTGQAQNESEVRLSHNDVITAYLWKKYAREWSDGEGNPATYVSCPVDIRRIPATLPKTYFGCALCLATTFMTQEDLSASSLGKIALTIRDAIRKMDRTYAFGSLETLESLRRQEGLAIIDKIHIVNPADGLLVTNLSRLPVMDLEFSAGAPTGFRILTPGRRAAVILPAEDGVEVRICHPRGRIRRTAASVT